MEASEKSLIKKKNGRPKGSRKVMLKDEDYRMIETLRGIGMTQKEIGEYLGVSEPTMVDMVKNDEKLSLSLIQGRTKAYAKVAQAAFNMASSGKNFNATAFWLRTQAGWKEKIEITGDVKHTVVFESEYSNGILRQNAKELPEGQKDIIEGVIDELTEGDTDWQSNESESQ